MSTDFSIKQIRDSEESQEENSPSQRNKSSMEKQSNSSTIDKKDEGASPSDNGVKQQALSKIQKSITELRATLRVIMTKQDQMEVE
jgi:hypothetical protein